MRTSAIYVNYRTRITECLSMSSNKLLTLSLKNDEFALKI